MAKILVAEDESSIRSLWARFLDRWGYEAVLAENGSEALNLSREQKFDVLITDLAMPVMTGQELIYSLKEEQPEIEILVTTGHGTVETAVEMMKAGAFDFLTKPINFSHAEMIIRKCIEALEAKQENVVLRQRNQDLEMINELKEKFIAITSHELRTPVGVMSNLVEILLPQAEKLESPSLFDVMNRTSQQLNEIVDQMHEMSRVYSDKLVLEKEKFPLALALEEVAEEFALVQEKRSQQVSVETEGELELLADRVKFKKVIRELLQNAIKFTPDGGKILVKGYKNGGDLLCEVIDNGTGVADQDKDKIFHLFYEVGDALHHHTSKDGYLGGGMGVGLAVVNDIVSAHDGEVEVLDQPGGGARFVVRFPQENGS